jgi:hypothetical protein
MDFVRVSGSFARRGGPCEIGFDLTTFYPKSEDLSEQCTNQTIALRYRCRALYQRRSGRNDAK